MTPSYNCFYYRIVYDKNCTQQLEVLTKNNLDINLSNTLTTFHDGIISINLVKKYFNEKKIKLTISKFIEQYSYSMASNGFERYLVIS